VGPYPPDKPAMGRDGVFGRMAARRKIGRASALAAWLLSLAALGALPVGPTRPAAASPNAPLSAAQYGSIEPRHVAKSADLIRSIGDFFERLATQSTNPQQQASLAKLAGEYGDIAGRVDRWIANGVIEIADLPPGQTISRRDRGVAIDADLAGEWRELDPRRASEDEWLRAGNLAAALVEAAASIEASMDYGAASLLPRRRSQARRVANERPDLLPKLVRLWFQEDHSLFAAARAREAANEVERRRWQARAARIGEELPPELTALLNIAGLRPRPEPATAWDSYGPRVDVGHALAQAATNGAPDPAAASSGEETAQILRDLARAAQARKADRTPDDPSQSSTTAPADSPREQEAPAGNPAKLLGAASPSQIAPSQIAPPPVAPSSVARSAEPEAPTAPERGNIWPAPGAGSPADSMAAETQRLAALAAAAERRAELLRTEAAERQREIAKTIENAAREREALWGEISALRRRLQEPSPASQSLPLSDTRTLELQLAELRAAVRTEEAASAERRTELAALAAAVESARADAARLLQAGGGAPAREPAWWALLERIRAELFWAFAALLLVSTYLFMRARSNRAETATILRPESAHAVTPRQAPAQTRLILDQSPASVLPDRLSELTIAERIEWAARLAAMPDAPTRLVAIFLRDDPAVAAPLLRQSPAIDDNTLLGLIRNGTREHRMAIAERVSLSEALVAALLEIGEPEVEAALAENPGVRFGALAHRRLPPAATEPESPPERHEIAASAAAAEPAPVAAEPAPVAAEPAPAPAETVPVPAEAVPPVTADRPGDSAASGDGAPPIAALNGLPASVAEALMAEVRRRRDIPFFEAVLAELSGLRPPQLHRVLYEKTGRDLALLAAALGLAEEVYCDLFAIAQGIAGKGEALEDTRAAALRQFRAVHEDRARLALTQWLASNPAPPEVYRG
jgi:uncharacterized protein (DUF2336 family)